MPSSHIIIRTKCKVTGPRFSAKAGEIKHFRFNYVDASFVPRIVVQCRNQETIDWGGALVQPRDYEVLFDGVDPLPLEITEILSSAGLV